MRVEILSTLPAEPVVLVDGTLGPAASPPPVLELSHWPGNRTPADLKHDLSTGCALRFAALDPAERARRTAGAALLANNHYDTDGTLALFAARWPGRALPLARELLDAAAAGDFFRWPSDRALALDAIVTGLAHDDASPLRSELEGLADAERWTRCTEVLHEELPRLLTEGPGPFAALAEPVLEAARRDRALLATAAREEDRALDLTAWTAPGGAQGFDPGRHALFGATERDLVLVLAPGPDGTRARLVLSTLSWFDLVSERRRPRPDLAALAARLNALEGGDPEGPLAWRAQPVTNASPELWFGTEELEPFAERNPALGASRLAPATILGEVRRAR